jgi:hypothetical protein
MLNDAIGGIPERFMVCDIGYRRSAAREAIGDGWGGMIEVLRGDQHITEPKKTLL